MRYINLRFTYLLTYTLTGKYSNTENARCHEHIANAQHANCKLTLVLDEDALSLFLSLYILQKLPGYLGGKFVM